MDIRLVSPDKNLYKLCCEILTENPDRDWTITIADTPDADAALHIWDFQPKGLLPDATSGVLSRDLFLVHRKDLPAFREQVTAAESNILLKPVTKVTLSAFLTQALAAYKEPVPAAHSLRADRDEIFQCLIQTNLRLQEYDQDRTNFLARAVHDFRAPLTALSGYCGLLLDEPLGPLTDSQKEILQRMQTSAKRLSRMASAMFQLSVGRHVKKRPELQTGDLGAALEQALHEIGPFAEEKCIEVSANLNPCGPDLYFEPEQIQQVLINILDNACKFTRKAGSIKITGYTYFWDRRKVRAEIAPGTERRQAHSRTPNSYRIDITDSGEAIPPEHLQDIFEEYTSYSGGRDRSGGGLGLAICKMIITQHEGHVWAENTDAGPRFSFVLPSQRAAEQEPLEALDTVQKLA